MIRSQLRQLGRALRRRPASYVIWLLANLGGLLVAYLATLTIWAFHKRLGSLVPGPEVVLITGALSVAVAGVSYINEYHHNRIVEPSLFFLALWPFLWAAVYGVLISMGVETPARDSATIWVIAVLLCTLCLIWASISWLHEQGLWLEAHEPAPPPPPPASTLADAAIQLPKLQPNARPAEEGGANA